MKKQTTKTIAAYGELSNNNNNNNNNDGNFYSALPMKKTQQKTKKSNSPRCVQSDITQ